MTRTKLILFGALAGTAWAAALRGYMAVFAGSASRFDLVGTMLQIVLPGAVIGALLGLAEYFRRTGGRRGWRWLALAPVLFVVAPMLTPGALWAFLTTGLGGGAVAVALTGIGGGFALSRRGPLWARIVVGVLAGALAAAGAAAVLFVGRGAEQVWAAVLAGSLLPLFALACSIPFRPVARR